jgi:hypothetical protein
MHCNLVVGISSRTSPVARRELLPLGRAADGALAEHIAARAPIHEALAFSTRERTDAYGMAASPELGKPAMRDQPE